MSALAAPAGDPLRRACRLVWPNLPVLLVGSLPVATGWAVLRMLPPQLGWLAVLGTALLVVPATAALIRGWEVLLADEHFGLADLARSLSRSFRPAVRVALLPTAAALLTLLAGRLWQLSGQTWMLVSVGMGLAVTLAALAVATVTLPYVVRTRAPLREGWLVGGFVATRNPVPVLAALSAVALGVWAAGHLSFAVLVLLPVPVTLVWVAAVTTATARSRDRIGAHPPRD